MIRDYQEKDFEQVNELCSLHNINLPGNGKIKVAVDDQDKVIGFILAREVVSIEPFICTNPFAAKKLYEEMFAELKDSGVNLVRCFAQAKHVNLYEKFNFKLVFNNCSIMEKEI